MDVEAGVIGRLETGFEGVEGVYEEVDGECCEGAGLEVW